MAVSEDFARLTDPFRPELLAHCYRMLGSVHDAEDQVQETMIRAWRSYGEFEGRASLRTWLYRIATNACLRALENSSRRPLPSGLGGPSEYPEAPLTVARPEVPWLQPIPDALVSAGSADPAEIVASRQSMRLALIAALQYLPARQRAVLILRDVLRWRAAEPADPADRALLDRYAAAFQNADVTAVMQLLREDAVFEMPPEPTWFTGRELIGRFLRSRVLTEPGRFQMIPTAANGQPAFAAYLRGRDGIYRAHSICVLTTAASRVPRVTPPAIRLPPVTPVHRPGLVAAFRLPPAAPAAPAVGTGRWPGPPRQRGRPTVSSCLNRRSATPLAWSWPSRRSCFRGPRHA